MDIKHIYWFSYFDLSEPGIRYRGKYVLEALKAKHNIHSSIVFTGYHPRNIAWFLRIFFSVLLFRKKDSLIVFQKIRTNRFYATALKILLFFRRKHTLYDIDDPDYLLFSEGVIRYFVKHCAACSVGSQALYEYCLRYNENTFIQTSPVISHTEIKRKKNNVFTVGWIGYYNAHKNSLHELLFPALISLNIKLKIVLLGVSKAEDIVEIQKYFEPNSDITVETPEKIDWRSENEVYSRIKEFDVGISPMLDNETNRAKSAFKLKQYMSCGVPVIASVVGENKTFLRDGVNGFLCNDAREFGDAIMKIYNLDKETYSSFSMNALNTIPGFSMETYCNSLLSYYKSRA